MGGTKFNLEVKAVPLWGMEIKLRLAGHLTSPKAGYV